MDILWKSVLGGLLTALIAWSAKRGTVLPGILPVFPTFALIALFVVGLRGETQGFRETCVAGLKTIPAYVAFFLACYLSAPRFDFRIALVVGLLAWFAVAGLIFLWPRSS